MRLFRYAVLAAALAVPVLVVGAPATDAASGAGAGGAGSAGRGRGPSAFATPSTVTPGTRVTFIARCSPAANAGGASAILLGSSLSLPQRIAMQPQSPGSFNFHVTVGLSASIAPGTYRLGVDCPGGTLATATLHVAAFPSGGTAAGDGTTSTTTSWNGLALTGIALIGAGAVVGGLALRRLGTTRERG